MVNFAPKYGAALNGAQGNVYGINDARLALADGIFPEVYSGGIPGVSRMDRGLQLQNVQNGTNTEMLFAMQQGADACKQKNLQRQEQGLSNGLFVPILA